MPKYTKMLQFDKKTAQKIIDRDQMCVFCAMGYHLDYADPFALQIQDIMHVVPKSSLGLGVEQNGVLGCRYHHMMMDNGSRGLREQMIGMLEHYLNEIYPGWSREMVTYHKHQCV